MPEEQIQQNLPPAISQSFEVWPENMPTVQLFRRLRNCWRISVGMKGPVWIGLDYQGVQSAMSMMGVKRKERAELFNGLMIMENAALEGLNSD